MLARASKSSMVPIPDQEMENTMITQVRVQHLYAYEPETGHLRYKVRLSPRVKVGDVVGGEASRYRYAGVDGEYFPLHHLVWFHQTGKWPTADLAFKDGNPGNTRIGNLVEQSKSETVNKHVGLRSTNKTGVKGISVTKSGRYQVHLYGPGGSRVIGTKFKSFEDAKAALDKAIVSGVELRSDTPLRRALHDAAYHARKTWRKLNFVSGGLHDWTDPNKLFAEVGFAPKRNCVLAPKDTSKPIGPGNTMWAPPKFDHSTKEGVRAYDLARQVADPERFLNERLLKKFGITAEQYKAKLAEQNGVCAICGGVGKVDRTGRVSLLVVDHNHDTKAIRGLLCKTCNLGLGYLKDKASLLENAATYLRKWEAVACEPLPDNVVSLKDHKA